MKRQKRVAITDVGFSPFVTAQVRNTKSAILRKIASRLEAVYGCPTLGNLRSPTWELIYIQLSARTNEANYQAAYGNIRSTFKTIERLANAKPMAIRRRIRIAGLGAKRSLQISGLAKLLQRDFGKAADQRLRQMSESDVFDYLVRLPGVGPKSALCVMLYSLDFDVFPVDINVQRILTRMGICPKGIKHRHAQKVLPRLIPTGLSKILHVTLVLHGRNVCKSTTPLCGQCVLVGMCEMGRRREGR